LSLVELTGLLLPQVRTGAKNRPGTGENDRADIWIGDRGRHCLAQLCDEQRGQRVAVVRGIEGDRGDTVVHLETHEPITVADAVR
jgi:hypothetical protein